MFLDFIAQNRSFRSFDDSEIFYSVLGNGKKKVFLYHGLMVDKNTWMPMARALSCFNKQYTFYIPDLRAHGESSNNKFDSDEPFLDIAKDMELLAKEVLAPGESAVMVMHSMSNVPGILMQKYGMGRWVSKYISLDHGLYVTYEQEEYKFPFFHFGKEFLEKGASVQDIIDNNKEYYQFAKLNEIDEELIKKFKRLHEIIIHSSFYDGRLKIIKKLEPMTNNVIMSTQTNFYNKYNQYNSIGSHYFKQKTIDLGTPLKDSGIPSVFLVGMQSGAFHPGWTIETINQYVPGSKIYKFHKSAHHMLLTEPIKTYNALKESLE